MPIKSQAGKESVLVYNSAVEMMRKVTSSEEDSSGWCVLCTRVVLILDALVVLKT